ncbi:hypothetical protein [Anaerosphaera multitolerans]|uniref:WD40 repeat domain-containing protein n=1 Tax=Anaerosphaera multitolerans TaxID=2487351 RepID=A0A437S4T0_9FIRM|nr:hypothetical protein [Anaerosphaera multitolerans]RVU54019.1 hypothetical protein EF514_09605 [Anaerosphaera multitolerans]
MDDLLQERIYFKEQVEVLRRKLNKSKENGILEENFKSELKELSDLEDKILTALVPYYRGKDNFTTFINIEDTLEIKNIKNNSSIRKTYFIDEKLYLVNTLEGGIYFLNINRLKDETIEINWSSPLEKIKEKVVWAKKIEKDKMVLFTAKNKIYLFKSNKFKNTLEFAENLKLGAVYNFNISKCIALNENFYVVEDGYGKLNLLEFKDEEVLKVFETDAFNCTAMAYVDENTFALGTDEGKLFLIEVSNGEFKIIRKEEIFSGKVRNLTLLEDEKGFKDKLMILGDEGKLKIVSLKESSIKSYSLKGNLFYGVSKEGTAIVLSEDGIMYLFEENFGQWSLNEKNIYEDLFFTDLLQFENSKYLAVDLDNNFKLIDVKRIRTAEDLWSRS